MHSRIQRQGARIGQGPRVELGHTLADKRLEKSGCGALFPSFHYWFAGEDGPVDALIIRRTAGDDCCGAGQNFDKAYEDYGISNKRKSENARRSNLHKNSSHSTALMPA